MPVTLGLLAMVALVLGLGAFGVGAGIEGAVLAPGTLGVENHRQPVQHQEGGTVARLLVREGDRVAAGQLLLQLDGAALRAERAIILSQLDEARARMSRLRAERDGLDAVAFPPELVAAAGGDGEVGELLEGQRRLFAARRASNAQLRARMAERIRQLENQSRGLAAQREAVRQQMSLLEKELARLRLLLGKGLARSSEELDLRRELARLAGALGALDADIARTGGMISESRLELVRIESAQREAVIAELRDLRLAVSELETRRLALDERLARLDIRAPVPGVVHGLGVHGAGAVVAAAEPILSIVPDESPLVARIRISTEAVDEVHAGQPVTLRFPGLDQRMTPAITGILARISADAFSDEARGASYYAGEVTLGPAETSRLGDVRLVPGMPVEAFITTEARTPLSYLLRPIGRYFARALRER
ncbi:HlyD family type I secretion periplasmic adaptor subunit [Meinhardsimonia xiamenensis]|jgi:HlyD family secretion protein|nr:HlyD family type I secretion periplasmic adaptor subunit [Meinhardsimonia xiamenensis]